MKQVVDPTAGAMQKLTLATLRVDSLRERDQHSEQPVQATVALAFNDGEFDATPPLLELNISPSLAWGFS